MKQIHVAKTKLGRPVVVYRQVKLTIHEADTVVQEIFVVN